MKYYVFIARDEEEFGRYPGTELGYKELRKDFVKVIRYKTIDGDCCILILSSDVKSTVCGQGIDDVERMYRKVAASINSVTEDAGLMDSTYKSAEKINVFVHVGGEGDKGVESLEGEIKKKVVNKKWVCMLLSSRFPERIDVTKAQIGLPDSENALNMLLERCEKLRRVLNNDIKKGFTVRLALDKPAKSNKSKTKRKYDNCCESLSIIKGVN